MNEELEAFRKEVEQSLSASEIALISKLKSFNTLNFHPKVEKLHCEVFQAESTMSIRVFLMDAELNEVFNSEGEQFVQSSISLVKDITFYPSSDKLDDLYDNHEVEIEKACVEAIVGWFAMCFAKSAPTINLPVFIQHHDSNQAFDLQSQAWIQI